MSDENRGSGVGGRESEIVGSDETDPTPSLTLDTQRLSADDEAELDAAPAPDSLLPTPEESGVVIDSESSRQVLEMRGGFLAHRVFRILLGAGVTAILA